MNFKIFQPSYTWLSGDTVGDIGTRGNTGSTGTVFTPTGSTGPTGSLPIWYISYTVSTGTQGGTATQNVGVPRSINTLTGSASTDVTLASNQLTIASGTYHITTFLASYQLDSNRVYIYNISDSVAETVSSSITVWDEGGICTSLRGKLIVTGGPKIYEIRHWTNKAGVGVLDFGVAGIADPTGVEVYLIGKITKLV